MKSSLYLIKSFITFHKKKIYMQRGKVNRIFRAAIKKQLKIIKRIKTK